MDSASSTVDLVFAGLLVLTLAAMWATYDKAGQPGFACLVPIYNVVALMEIVGRPASHALLFLVPIVNLGFWFLVMLDLAGKFNKGPAFGLGLAVLPFVFFPVLGFSHAQHEDQDSGASPHIGIGGGDSR